MVPAVLAVAVPLPMATAPTPISGGSITPEKLTVALPLLAMAPTPMKPPEATSTVPVVWTLTLPSVLKPRTPPWVPDTSLVFTSTVPPVPMDPAITPKPPVASTLSLALTLTSLPVPMPTARMPVPLSAVTLSLVVTSTVALPVPTAEFQVEGSLGLKPERSPTLAPMAVMPLPLVPSMSPETSTLVLDVPLRLADSAKMPFEPPVTSELPCTVVVAAAGRWRRR